MRRKVMLLCAAVALLGAEVAWAKSSPVITMPAELYLSKPAVACVERFDISPKMKISERKERLLRFLDAAFAETNSWKISFTVAGIDYKDYQRFYVVYYHGCEEPGNLIEGLERNFDHSLSVLKDENSGIISSMDVLAKFKNPAEIFRHSVRDRNIGECLIKLEVPSINKALEAYLLTQAVWKKYRIPLIDVGWKNGKIFLLILRGCGAQREELMNLVFELAKRSGLPLEPLVSKRDLNPSVNEYLSTLAQ